MILDFFLKSSTSSILIGLFRDNMFSSRMLLKQAHRASFSSSRQGTFRRSFSTKGEGSGTDGIIPGLLGIAVIGAAFGMSFMGADEKTPQPCSEKAPTQGAQSERTN